jgi:hypothetical protein
MHRGATTADAFRRGVETNTQSIEGTKYEAQFGADTSALDSDDPFAIDANAFGKLGLVKVELLAAVSNDRA